MYMYSFCAFERQGNNISNITESTSMMRMINALFLLYAPTPLHRTFHASI